MKIIALTMVSCPYVIARYSAFVRKFPQWSFFLIEIGRNSQVYDWEASQIKR